MRWDLTSVLFLPADIMIKLPDLNTPNKSFTFSSHPQPKATFMPTSLQHLSYAEEGRTLERRHGNLWQCAFSVTAHFAAKLPVYALFFQNFPHVLDPVKEVRGTANSCFLLYLFWQDELCKSEHSVGSVHTDSIIVGGDCAL